MSNPLLHPHLPGETHPSYPTMHVGGASFPLWPSMWSLICSLSGQIIFILQGSCKILSTHVLRVNHIRCAIGSSYCLHGRCEFELYSHHHVLPCQTELLEDEDSVSLLGIPKCRQSAWHFMGVLVFFWVLMRLPQGSSLLPLSGLELISSNEKSAI